MPKKNDIFLNRQVFGQSMKEDRIKGRILVVRILVAAVFFLVVSGTGFAATLYGSIYDIELNELNGVVVEVDSSPAQRYVSKDGRYLFELGPGEYTLSAKYVKDYTQLRTEERVIIADDGDFIFDIFLFPEVDVDDSDYLTEDDFFDFSEDMIHTDGRLSGLMLAVIVVSGMIILLLIYYAVGVYRRRIEEKELEDVGVLENSIRTSMGRPADGAKSLDNGKSVYADMDSDISKVVNVIRSEGGRATQKEIRKQIPLSEAKISLMVSELEHKGIVKKVKKGRGNIIILKNKKD